MTDAGDRNSEKTQLQGSQRLTSDLRRLCLPDFEVPADVDEAVRARVRRHFGAGRHARLALRWLPVAAAAAAVLLAVVLSRPVHEPRTRRAEPSLALPTAASALEDVDQSGTVDILDAFKLARMIEDRTTDSSAWDLNADGVVDRDDVDAVALAAVRLRRGNLQ